MSLFEFPTRHSIFPPMMTLDAFTLLNESDQAEVLLDRGIFLTERLYKNFTIFLYQVDSFYVEVFYNLRFNTVQGMRSFRDDEEALEPYLDSIDISCLYS